MGGRDKIVGGMNTEWDTGRTEEQHGGEGAAPEAQGVRGAGGLGLGAWGGGREGKTQIRMFMCLEVMGRRAKEKEKSEEKADER